LLLVIDPDGTLRYANRAASWLLGHEPDGFTATNFLSLVPPDDVDLVARALVGSSAASGVQTEPLRLRAAHADGGWRSMEIVGNNLLDDDRVNGIVVTGRGVTRRGEAEEAPREGQ